MKKLPLILLALSLSLPASGATVTESVTINSSTGNVLNTPAVNYPTGKLKLNGVTLESTFQPLNAGLTSIAGLATQEFGRNMLLFSSGSDARAGIGLGLSADVQFNSLILGALDVTGVAGIKLHNPDDFNAYTSIRSGSPIDSGETIIFMPLNAGTLIGSGDVGTVTDTMLDGGITNAKLANSAITINGTSVALGGSVSGLQTTSGVLALAGFSSITGTLADARIASASTWNAKENALTFSTGLTRSTNTITVNADAGLPSQTGNSGKYLTTNGTTSSWATVATGLTIGSTAITSGTSGRLLTSGTTVGELTLGTGVLSWLGTPTETNLKAAQSGLAWLDTAQTFTAAQTISKGSSVTPLAIDYAATVDSADHVAIQMGPTGAVGANHTRLHYGVSAAQGWFGADRGDGDPLFYASNTKFAVHGSLGIGAYFLNSNYDTILTRSSAGVLTLTNGTTTSPATLQIWGTSTGSKYMALTHDGTNAVISASSGSVNITAVTKFGASNATAITNIRHGTSGAMTAGAVTVTDAGCTANTRYYFTTHTRGTITIPAAYDAATRTPGTSFVITSNQITDTSTVDWTAIEP
jgi:hypothetical protein